MKNKINFIKNANERINIAINRIKIAKICQKSSINTYKGD